MRRRSRLFLAIPPNNVSRMLRRHGISIRESSSPDLFFSFPTGGNEHGRHGTDGAAHFFLQGIHKNTGQSSDWNRAPSLGRHNDVVEFCHEKIYKGRAFLLHCFSFRTARNSPGPRRVRKSGAFGKRTNQKEKAKKAQHQEEDIEGPPRQTQRKARLVRFFDTGAA